MMRRILSGLFTVCLFLGINQTSAHASETSISGTVTDDQSGAPIESICVFADSGSDSSFASTDPSGRYALTGLASGSYTIEFSDCSGSGYNLEYWDNQSDWESADPVSVAAGQHVTGIDAGLALMPDEPCLPDGGSTSLRTNSLATLATPEVLAQKLVGDGVAVSNVNYRGSSCSSGSFTSSAADVVGFAEGVILSSGDVGTVRGPNGGDGSTGYLNKPGDVDLDGLSGQTTFDATVLEFDFVADSDVIYFQYAFASEEYNEYVNSSYNDTFAFFVNGSNCAKVPGTDLPVTINTINNGNPYGSNASNPQYFRNNDLEDGGGSIDTEMDGSTTVLTCVAAVHPGTNHMKLAIADASDAALDSNVFLKQGSLTTTPPCTEDGLEILRDTPARGAASAVIHNTVEPAVRGVRPELGEAVHSINCDYVVPSEQRVPPSPL